MLYRCRLCANDNKRLSVEEIGDYKYYKYRVKEFTEYNFRKHYYDINPELLPRNNHYPLDHKYSVREGFNNNIPPYIIGSFVNLQLGLTKTENSVKGKRCSISQEVLIKSYFLSY